MVKASLTKLFNINESDLEMLVNKLSMFHTSRAPRYPIAVLSSFRSVIRACLQKRKLVSKTDTIVVSRNKLEKNQQIKVMRGMLNDDINLENMVCISLKDIGISKGNALRLLFKLFVYAYAYYFIEKRYRYVFRYFIRGYFEALIFLSGVTASASIQEVYFWGFGYDVNIWFTSNLLRNNTDISTTFYDGSPFPGVGNYFIADKVIVANKWIYEIAKQGGIYKTQKYYIGRTGNFNICQPYITVNDVKKKSIALYFSGNYVRFRTKWDAENAIKYYYNLEQLFMQFVKSYALVYPKLTFVLFFHPSAERNVRLCEVKDYYKALLELRNVRPNLHLSAKEQFDDYEIGLSTGSSTVLERIDTGHKAAYVFPPKDSIGQYTQTSLRNILINDGDIMKVEKLRTMPRKKFFEQINFVEVIKR